MDPSIRYITKELRAFREDYARRKNIEQYKVLHNETIELIAREKPETNVDLLAIKGIGATKAKRFGADILRIIRDAKEAASASISEDAGDGSTPERSDGKDHVYSVGEFIARLNNALRKKEVHVRGEIFGSVDVRGRAVYFKIKDAEEEAVLSCFAWTSVTDALGVTLAEGMEITVRGFPEVYAPSGRFNLHVEDLILSGEGALKKAFEELTKKLKEEGLFAEERKRALPRFPQRIGLVTARGSDAERDVITHLGNRGYTIIQEDVRVEGMNAVNEISEALKKMNDVSRLDLVILVRGGGSLESLQAFNSERVARAIEASRVPVVCGVGHERDVTIADMVADVRASTPTDAGTIVGRDWEALEERVDAVEENLMRRVEMITERALVHFDRSLETWRYACAHMIRSYDHLLTTRSHRLIERIRDQVSGVREVIGRFEKKSAVFSGLLTVGLVSLKNSEKRITDRLHEFFRVNKDVLRAHSQTLALVNPDLKLKQGYSITLAKDGKVVKKKGDVKTGDTLTTRVSDGEIESTVE